MNVCVLDVLHLYEVMLSLATPKCLLKSATGLASLLSKQLTIVVTDLLKSNVP